MQRAGGAGVMIVLGLVAGACSSEAATDATSRDAVGSIVKAGTLGTAMLRVGDCFDESATGVITTVEGLPCSEPHDGQVVARVMLDREGSWPGAEVLIELAATNCSRAGAAAASALADVANAPTVALAAYVPAAPAWAAGDRNVICWLAAPTGAKLGFDLVPDPVG